MRWLPTIQALKMRRLEIRLAGFGGQGILFSGVILAKAIARDEKLHVVQTQSYGPESRGGAVRSDVIISDRPIDYPKLMKIDILLAMSQPALDAYEHHVRKGGFVVVDPEMVRPSSQRSHYIFSVSAARMARELGTPLLANIVMLGALMPILKIVPKETVIRALEDTLSGQELDDNLRALENGVTGVVADRIRRPITRSAKRKNRKRGDFGE